MQSNYDAKLYDMVHQTSVAGDIEWYLGLAKGTGGPVLELGAGTGRTLLPIARAGVEIHALELDAGMLERLRFRITEEPMELQKLVKTFAGDMSSFELSGSYRLVQIPFRAFLHNLDRASQLSCLKCCLKHLEPGGIIAFNMFHPSLTFMSNNQGQLEGVWRWRADYDHPEGGRIVMSDANKYDTIRQTLKSKLRYEHFDTNGVLQSVHMQHLDLAYLYAGDVRHLMQEAGFEDCRIDGDSSGNEMSRDGCEMFVTARKP